MKKLLIVFLFLSSEAKAEAVKYRIKDVKRSDSFLCLDYYESKDKVTGLDCTNEKTGVVYTKIIIGGEILIEKVTTK